MSNNIELLSQYENFTIGTNSNLSEILANVVKVGTDTSNVTISIPQDISSSYNLILPVRQGASGESLVYGADGQLKWHDTTVLKQVISVYGSNLTGNVVSTGIHDSPTYLDAYTANIVPMADNSKIFVQFKVNYKAALSASNQISFYIKKTDTNGNTLATFSESLFGPYNGAGGFVGQYISNLVDEATTTNQISYQLGYQINGNVYATDTLGILGYEGSYNNTIVLQEFEGSGSNATSVWNKGADSNGLYYNDGTVHIGSTKNALGSQNTPGVALELSGNLVGTNATFSGNITAYAINVEEAHIGPNTLFINGMRVLNQNQDTGSINVYTDQIISESTNGLTIQANGNNGNIILDPSGTGSIQLNGDVQLSGGNINAETFIGDLSGNVNAITMAATTTTTTHLNLNGNLVTSSSSYVEGNLIPSANVTYDLGSSTHMWRDVYVGPGSLYVNNKKVIEDNNNTINITTDVDQNLTIKTSGTGVLQLNSNVGGIDFNTSNGGTINFNSDIVLQGSISMTNTGSTIPINLNDDVDVAGNLDVNGNLDVGGNLKVNRINREDPLYSGLYLEDVIVDGSSITGNVTGNVTGHVTGTVSSLTNHTTDNLTEGSTNLYYTAARIRGDVSGGLGINYNESTGVFSLPQEVSTSSDVTFDNVTASSSLVTHNAQINNDLTVNKDLTVAGNITVNGTQTIVNSTVVEIGDNKIVLNAGGLSSNDAGIIANVNNGQHEFIFKSADSVWYSSEAIQSGTGFMGELTGNVVGDVTGNLVGDVNGNLVGNVTGDVTGNVSGVLTGSMTMTGHILPDTNAVYDIGSAERKVRHMYLSSNSLWIGDEHKATINPSNNQLEFRRRKTDAIPQSFIAAGINDTSQILTAAGEASLSNMSLSKWKQVARNLGITINGKTDLEIDPTDIFDTGESDDWQTTLDVKTIADNVSSLQTLTTNQGTTLSAVETNGITNSGDITSINSSILTINSDISTAQTNISSLQTSVASKQATITTTTDLSIRDLTLSGCLRGPSTMYIDPADNGVTGTLIVNGNLEVKGTTTTIDSETLLIADNSIILNKNYTGSSPTEDASIEIKRGSSPNAIIKWNETNDQWEFYKEGTTNLSNIKCNTLKVSDATTLGITSASVSSTTLNINGDANSSYGVYSLSGSITTINTISVSNVGNNSQILIYYTNNSGSDLTIDNTITGCKTNLSEALTVSNGSSVLFCLVNINSTYILTVSQLY